MRQTFIHRYVAIIAITCISLFSQAQVAARMDINEKKPYKILTSGKQITVKSTKYIKNIMVWTASGHRILEQKDIKAASFSFNVNVSEKVFFLMIEFEGSRPYTEKIGVQ